MKRKFFIIGIILMGMASCKAIPYAYEKWHKFGTNKVKVKKALLECGAPNPSYYENGDFRHELNALASIHLCMLQSGFRYDGSANWCRERPEGRLPVCSESIPTRNASRRLEGPYCKLRTDRSYCMKMAPHPDLCEDFYFKNPSPECLP